jgi:hypothetical protein
MALDNEKIAFYILEESSMHHKAESINIDRASSSLFFFSRII